MDQATTRPEVGRLREEDLGVTECLEDIADLISTFLAASDEA